MRAERVAIAEIFAPHHVIAAQIDDPEVGVVFGGDVALASQPESLRDIGRGDRSDVRYVELVLRQQQLPGRLAA